MHNLKIANSAPLHLEPTAESRIWLNIYDVQQTFVSLYFKAQNAFGGSVLVWSLVSSRHVLFPPNVPKPHYFFPPAASYFSHFHKSKSLMRAYMRFYREGISCYRYFVESICRIQVEEENLRSYESRCGYKLIVYPYSKTYHWLPFETDFGKPALSRAFLIKHKWSGYDHKTNDFFS